MEDNYKIEHLDLMNELEELIGKLDDITNGSVMFDARINEEIRNYAEFNNNMLAGEFPSIAWKEYDNKYELEKLIKIAKEDIERLGSK